MRTSRRIAGIATGLGVAAGSLLAASTPAQAYDNDDLTAISVTVRMDSNSDCASPGDNIRVESVKGGCHINDSADGTLFKYDAQDGQFEPKALKWELYRGTDMVAKVEFHPYGEKLWVYDTANDGDTIYVSWSIEGSATFAHVVRPPATSNRIDYTVQDLTIDEGHTFEIKIWDDSRPANDGGSYEIGYDELDGTLATA